jgi:hypothetical protein
MLLSQLFDETGNRGVHSMDVDLDAIMDEVTGAPKTDESSILTLETEGIESIQQIINMKNLSEKRLHKVPHTGVQMAAIEADLRGCLQALGKDRFGMPESSTTPLFRRKIEREKLYPFCKLKPWEIDRQFLLNKFSAIVPGYEFNTRTYEEAIEDLP